MWNKKRITLALSALALAACSSLPASQTPDQAVRHSVQRQFAQDSRYNFSGDTHWKFNTLSNQSETDAKSYSLPSIWSQFILNTMMHLNHTGAVDLSQGKIEFIPELHLQSQRNIQSSVKFPIQLNLQQKTLYVDPEAITFFTDSMAPTLNIQPINGKLVSFTLPPEISQRIPLKTLAKILPKAMDDGYASLPAEQFQREELDDFGKSLNANTQIGIKMTTAQTMKMNQAMVKSMREQLAAEPLENGETQENRDNVVQFLQQFESFLTQSSSEPDDAPAALAQSFAQLYENSIEQSRFYLDRRGRLLGMNIIWQMPLRENTADNIVMDTKIRYDYSRAPNFTLNTAADNVVDLSCALHGNGLSDCKNVLMNPKNPASLPQNAVQEWRDWANEHDAEISIGNQE